MIEIPVRGSLDIALKILDRKLLNDGVTRELKVHAIPKPSERKRFKKFLAARRKLRDQAKRRRGGDSPWSKS